jgi:methyl-accepting chemotaxis protein
MMEYLKKHLSVKILVVLLAILLISFTGLGISIISKQSALLSGMRGKVFAKLKETGENTKSQFGSLEKIINGQLADMGKRSAAELTTKTTKALTKEEDNIRKGMDALLVNNAEAVAASLSKVAEDAIMAKKYDQLIDFSRAVAQTKTIVYAFFLDRDGKLLPGYVNLVDSLVLSYLPKEGEDFDDAMAREKKVLDASRNDPRVLVHESVIEYYNLPIGKIIVCVSKSVVAGEIDAMRGRFDELKKANEQSIKNIIENESAEVNGRLRNQLASVVKRNVSAMEETGNILESSAKEVKTGTTRDVVLVGTLICLGVLAAVAIMLKIMVIGPIHEVTEGLRDTAQGEGDLTKRLNIPRVDEIGMLAKWFDTFVAKLNNIIVDIGANAETVTSSALEVLSASERMRSESDDLKSKANTVATASEEMNVSMNSVAAASEQAATNISFVAEAAAAMKVALDEVVKECEQAKGVSHSATEQVHSATGKVNQLGEAAREISKVSEVITEIADQTNLLALNATIEAARAGEAGKGFAVVAGEIKDLAHQTRQATQQIKARITGIQQSTDDTVSEVDLIAKVIEKVDSIMTKIAMAMEEQSGQASEVARNIEQASMGIAEVNENVAQSSQVSGQIAGDISEVDSVASEMSARSGNMRQNLEGLSDLALQLKTMISIFKVSVQDAEKRGD